MAKVLAIVNTEEQQPKPKRERIEVIEAQPKDDWFVRSRTSSGREVWYLRFQLTGQHPRLFGPFKSKHQSLLFLDAGISALLEVLTKLDDECNDRMIHEKCQKIWPPIIEYPIISKSR